MEFKLVTETREATQIVMFEETEYGVMLFKTEQGHTVVRTDEFGGIYLDCDLLDEYKTSFFRLQANQGGIVLTPARMKLELVKEEENLLGGPRDGKTSKLKEDSGNDGGEQESTEVLAQSGGS